MFIDITIILLIVSFVLAVKSARKLNDKPSIKDVKRSLDKDRVIYHSSSES
jgi:hypothetical protein